MYTLMRPPHAGPLKTWRGTGHLLLHCCSRGAELPAAQQQLPRAVHARAGRKRAQASQVLAGRIQQLQQPLFNAQPSHAVMVSASISCWADAIV